MTQIDSRLEYTTGQLLETQVDKNPFAQFSNWFAETLKKNLKEPYAMTLATCDTKLVPQARVVLLRKFDTKGFVFFTNYESKKAKDLAENPQCSLLFFWPELERQVRILGIVEKVSQRDSHEYFQTRPKPSQIAAYASQQSEKISSRDFLEKKFKELEEKYASEAPIPLPSNWGGYLVRPSYFEFWQGRASRLHDRIYYELKGKDWEMGRLSP